MNELFLFIKNNIAYFFLAVMLVNFALLVWMVVLHKKWRSIFRGESGNLDEAVRAVRAHQDATDAERADLVERVKNIETSLPKNIRKVGLVRYNPFSDAGGDQSFALAMLNEDGDGIVLSSLYGREMNRVYAKPIEKGASKYQLSEEEKKAIYNAQ